MNPPLAPSPTEVSGINFYSDKPKQMQQEPPSPPNPLSISDQHHSHQEPYTVPPRFAQVPQLDGHGISKGDKESTQQDAEEDKINKLDGRMETSNRNPITAEMAFSLRREILAREFSGGTAGNMRQSRMDRFSPIIEEDFSGRSPRFEAPIASPLTGIESASTESTKTVKWSSMPQTPGAHHASTPSYPFPTMNTEAGTSTEATTPALHRPFTALSPTIAPFQNRSTETLGSKRRSVTGHTMSIVQKSLTTFGKLGGGDMAQEQGPDLYEVTLKLQSEPGLDNWWANVAQIMQRSFGASRATLAVPSDSTDVENVPWAQMATFNTGNDDHFSSGTTRDLQSIHSGVTDSSGQEEARSELVSNFRGENIEQGNMNSIDASADRPKLESRHSFAGFPQRLDPATTEARQSTITNPQRPNVFRANSHFSLRSGLPISHESFQGVKLSSESLEQHLAAQPEKAPQSVDTLNTRERETRARVLPVLQMLEMEPDPLLSSVGVVRVLERGKSVQLTRDYSDTAESIDRGQVEGTEDPEHRTSWPTPESKARKLNANPSEKTSKSPSFLGSRLVKRPRSYTSGSSMSASGAVNTKDELPDKFSHTLLYEDYEQIPPSPWSQSPAPSPAVQADPEVNPFFVNALVDEEAFSENPPAHDYASERQIEVIGVDRASSILHVPLVHPIVSKPKRQQRLKEVSGKRRNKIASGSDASSALPHTSLSSSEDDRKWPIAILSIMSSTVPYPTSLASSLNLLAPHLATSLYNARQHSDLEKQLAGVSRRHHIRSHSSERRNSHQNNDFTGNDFFSPPSTESVTSASEYSSTSRHSPRGSNVGTPGWDSSSQAPLDDQTTNRPLLDITPEANDTYFGPRKRNNPWRTPSGTISATIAPNTDSFNVSMNAELVQGPVIRNDQQSFSTIDPRLGPTTTPARPIRRTKTASATLSEDHTGSTLSIIDRPDRACSEGQSKESTKRDASPSRRHTEILDSPRRQAMLQASGQANERSQTQHHKHLHTHGATFGATNPSLPAATAKLPSALPKDEAGNPREEDFTFRPPTSSMMRIMIDSGAIQEFIAEPLTGNICWANSRFQTYRNESAAQIRRKPWDTIHHKDQKTFRKLWTSALHTGDQISHQVRLKRFDGQYRWFHIRIVPIKDSYSSIKNWHGQAMDIHEQHIAEVNAAREKEKAASESKYRSLANSNPHIIFAASVPDGMTFANTQWLSYSGQSFDDALGFGFLDHVHPDDIVKCQFPALGNSGNIPGPPNPTPKAHSRDEESSSSVDMSEISTTTDDTMKARTPGSTYDGTPASSQVIPPSGLLRNLASKGIIKASRDGQGRLSITSEMRLKSESGQYRWHLVQGSLIESVNFGQGDAQWIIACADISDQKHIEDKLKDANATLESETTRKMQFLSTMSHEIRTPLNGIIGNLQFLLNSNLDDYQSEWTYGADAAARGMHDLINDILDVSKAEAKMLTLYYDWFHIRSIIEDVFETLASKANEKRLELCYFLDNGVPSNIKGDAGRIRQILLNLVSNAIKFTQRGEVCVDCRVKSTSLDESMPANDSNEVTLLFNVQDTGSGFTEDDAKILFKPYSQIDNSNTRNNGGTGLGLLLCKQMVELHHGDISAFSTPGKGSTFTFSARFRLPTPTDRPKGPSKTGSDENSSSGFIRGKKQVFGRGLVTSPGEISVMAETVGSSGSSIPSLDSSVRAAYRSPKSSVSSPGSVGNLTSSNVAPQSKQTSGEEGLVPEAVKPSEHESPHPTTYSILIVCPHEHTRRATEAHIQQILPKSIPAQVATSEDVIASQSMMSGEEPIHFTHVVLQLNDAEEILAFMDLILNSKSHLHTSIVIITDQAQQVAIMAGNPSFDYDQLRANRRLFFLLKPAKPPKFAKIFDPRQESALSKDYSRADRMEHTDITKQAFKKFEDTLGHRNLRVLAVEDNKLNMKVCNMV